MKKLIFSLLFGILTLTSAAQETVYQINEVSVINYGDGRLLFRQINEQKTPLNGSHRLIDGYRSEYILADFKDGMYDGNYQYFKSNKLKETGTYKEGRKDGIYKEYYSDGVAVKSEKEYKDGKLNGLSKSYFTDGKLESEKGYAMSVEHGVERKYDYETGKIKTERNYVDGKQHGKQIAFFTSNIGDFVETSTYENGKRIGEFSEIFSDGMIKSQGSYNGNGRKDGEWLERDSFSSKEHFSGRTVLYNDGEVVSSKEIKNFEKFQLKKTKKK